VVTAVAANLSGLDTLLVARPGSSPMAIPMASNLT
jgi:hypothetical protein